MGRTARRLGAVLATLPLAAGLVSIAAAGRGSATASAQVTRLSGVDRVATAISISASAFPAGANSAVLSRSDDFPDALAGTPLAVAKGGPLLLTPPAGLDPRVAAELQRLLPSGASVYLLGGTAALSDAVAAAVTNLGFRVVRLAGADRFETAAVVAAQGLGSPTTVFVTTGTAFADALVSGVAAAAVHGAVLLTNGASVPAATAQYLSSHGGLTVHAVGGSAAAAGIATTDSFVGTDRYDTARLVATHFFPAPTSVGIASGATFADGLSGGTQIARVGGPLLLSGPAALPTATQQYLGSAEPTITTAYLYGGTAAVSAFAEAGVQAAITGAPPPTTTSTTGAPAPAHFSTLPPGAPLPDDATCASEVRATPENRPDNATTNATRGVQKNLTSPYPTFARVDGNYAGTTDEIIQWVACKWGIDEDVVRAQASIESWWHQSTLGDWGTDAAACAIGYAIGVDPSGHPGQCPQSVGLLQVRYPYWTNGFPQVETSTAYNADYAYAAWRACFEGQETWLNTVDRVGTYGPGDMWGCLGVWYSGRWRTSAADGYIAAVQQNLSQRVWEQPDFTG
ncbi:MAG TPA: cell wall-binding repeat-containing protein [Acidimicrobiales bacterium]|nr:cell wall-binding repeat-containing protein [Acidimicrobiales bacterium]